MSNDKPKTVMVSSPQEDTARAMAAAHHDLHDLHEQGHEMVMLTKDEYARLMQAQPAKPPLVKPPLVNHSERFVERYAPPSIAFKGASTQGSDEYFAEREARLTTQVAKAKAALDKITANKAEDTGGLDERITELSARISAHTIDITSYQSRIDRIDISIADRRAEIARIERDIELMLADKRHVEGELIPMEENARETLGVQMTAAREARAAVDKKWHKHLNEAEKEHRQLDLRLTRLRLRKPKPAPVETAPPQPTKLPSGLHTMPGPPDEGNA